MCRLATRLEAERVLACFGTIGGSHLCVYIGGQYIMGGDDDQTLQHCKRSRPPHPIHGELLTVDKDSGLGEEVSLKLVR